MDIPRTWRLQNQRYRLEGSQCENCGMRHFPPRLECPGCRHRSLKPYPFSGKGRIYSYTTMYQAAPQFADTVPYVVALIDLEEGPRVTAQLTDIDPEDVHIDMPVEMVVRKISEEGERGLIMYGYKFRPVLKVG